MAELPSPKSSTVGTGPAYQLLGLTLNGRWQVKERRSPNDDDTGGYFSVGYFADDLESHSSDEVFVKALDYSRWNELPFANQADAISCLTDGFRFERDIVVECAGLRMRNVVKGLDSGSVEVTGFQIFNHVDFIVFEKAESDLRGRFRTLDEFDTAWKLHVLHNVAKGLRQLHQARKAHLDLKPSNVLCFDQADMETMAKVGDLGRAHDPSRQGPHSDLVFPGDRTYAPPEILYSHIESDRTLQTRQIDMYLLGSMMTYMFTGIGMTTGILMNLDPTFLPGAWDGTYMEVLPYLREAYESHMELVEEEIVVAMRKVLMPTIRELTDPDVGRRGHSKDPYGSMNRFSMEKYVSILNRLSRDAEMKLKEELR